MGGNSVADAASEILIAVVAAFAASGITYAYSIVVERKGKLYDAKVRVYASLLGSYQESLVSIEGILNLYGLTCRKENFEKELLAVGSLLRFLPSDEFNRLMIDNKALDKAIRQSGGEEPFLQKIRAETMRLLLQGLVEDVRMIRLQMSELPLIRPNPKVVNAIVELFESLEMANRIQLRRIAESDLESSSLSPFASLVNSNETMEDWLKKCRQARGEMLVAMNEDLQDTIGWRPGYPPKTQILLVEGGSKPKG
jgi:hypothetical protein